MCLLVSAETPSEDNYLIFGRLRQPRLFSGSLDRPGIASWE
jgi:hypothetical protein